MKTRSTQSAFKNTFAFLRYGALSLKIDFAKNNIFNFLTKYLTSWKRRQGNPGKPLQLYDAKMPVQKRASRWAFPRVAFLSEHATVGGGHFFRKMQPGREEGGREEGGVQEGGVRPHRRRIFWKKCNSRERPAGNFRVVKIVMAIRVIRGFLVCVFMTSNILKTLFFAKSILRDRAPYLKNTKVFLKADFVARFARSSKLYKIP